MRGRVQDFLRDESGAGAAEFALVLPVLLVMLFGIIDVGRLMWTWNQAEKATQMGARYAVATEMVPATLASYDFAISGGISQGNPIPESSFGGATCTSTGCTCKTGATCPTLGFSATAFANVVARMQMYMPQIAATNVAIDYDYSGLGFAGDPNGTDVEPLVTVRLTGMEFEPLTLLVFGTTITLPAFRSALTAEDATGNFAN